MTIRLLAVAALVAASPIPACAEDMDLARLPRIGRVHPRYQSYNVEMAEIVGGRFWAPYPKPGSAVAPLNTQASGGLALEAGLFRQRPPADLSNFRLRNLARALGPAYVRVSGSWANTTYFQDDGAPRLIQPPKGFQNVLTRAQWAGVFAFAKAVDARIVTSFPVSAGTRDPSGNWTPDEVRKLLRYSRRIGGHVYAAELVNEPNLGGTSGLPANYDAARFAADVATFRSFIAREFPALKTVGPGSTGETGVALFANRGLASAAMLGSQPRPHFDYFSYHFYGGRSQRCAKMAPASAILPENALTEEWLGRTDTALAFYKDLRDRFMPGAPIWLNETAQASCGGDMWAASFLDSFRYVDQLGRLARQGVSAVFHNTLAASDYGLIDEATLTPRPNYWAALLWRRLMGETVLAAGPSPRRVHLYAHCLRGQSGGVALVALNLDATQAANLTISRPGQRYTLTAERALDQTVQLNGHTLTMKDDRLPPLRFLAQPSGQVTLAPASITFLALPTARNPACR